MTAEQPNQEDEFVGAWRLISYEFRDDAGSKSCPFGQNPRGVIMYDRSGMMSVQIIRNDRPLFPSEDMFGAAPETVKAAFEGLNTYYGSFAVDGKNKIVTHHIEGASMPNRTGSTQVRHYEFAGKQLILKAPPRLLDGKILTGVLIWERISDVRHMATHHR